MKDKPDRIFVPAIVLLFFFLGLVGIMHHVLWHDEAQAWCLARDSATIPQLLFNMRYESHPPLWHVLLFFISRFARDPFAMQVFHLLLATFCTWVFIKFAPFSRYQKVFFTFGFFPLYQFTVISRCYAMGILFLFLFCVFYAKKNKSYVFLFALLFFASISNFVAAILAFGLGLFVLSSPEIWDWRGDKIRKANAMACTFLYIGTTCLIALLLIHIPSDTVHPWAPFHLIMNLDQFLLSLSNINQAYLPFEKQYLGLNITLSILELLFFSLLFLSRPRVLLFFIVSTAGILMMTFIKHAQTRHIGHLFYVLIISLWLLPYVKPTEIGSRILRSISMSAEKILVFFLIAIFWFHLRLGIMAFENIFDYKYSGSKDAADFIRSNHLENDPILGFTDEEVTSIAAYLDKPVYYPQSGKFGTYCLWNRERMRHITPEVIYNDTQRLAAQYQMDVVLVFTQPFPQIFGLPDMKLLGYFNHTISGENFFVYLYTFPKSS